MTSPDEIRAIQPTRTGVLPIGIISRFSPTLMITAVAACVLPIIGPLAHWWKNYSKKPTVLLSADILPPDMKPDESM
jgi:hypothetical protein